MSPRFQERIMLCFTVHKGFFLQENSLFHLIKVVISAFGEHFVKKGIFSKEMGRDLNRAFEKRQIGDYEYTFVISKMDAEEIFKAGKSFLEK